MSKTIMPMEEDEDGGVGRHGAYLPPQTHQKILLGTSQVLDLVVQQLRLHAPKAAGPVLIASQGTRPHMSN